MALTKPPVLPAWAEGGEKVQPSDAEIQAGWPLSNVPPSRQRFNWILNFLANGVRYFARRGLPDYDAAETYLTGDCVIGDDGKTYRSLKDNNIKNVPSASSAWWEEWAPSLSRLGELVQKQSYTAFTTAGAAPNYTITPSPAIASYAAGQRFRVKFHAAGNGADLLNVSGRGNKSLKQYDSAGAKVAAIIKANQLSDVEYDGTDFVILDALPPQAATAATATADGAAGTAIYAKDSDTTARNKAATPAGVAAQIAAAVGEKISPPVEILANTDLDTIKTAGFYYSRQNVISESLLNSPTGYAFALLVEKHHGCKQTITEYHTGGAARMWFRNYGGTSWGPWQRVIDTNALTDYGIGISATSPKTYSLAWPTGDMDANPMSVPSGFYRATTGVQNKPGADGNPASTTGLIQWMMYDNVGGRSAMLYMSLASNGRAAMLLRLWDNGSGSWGPWAPLGNLEANYTTDGTAPAYTVATAPYHGELAAGQRLRLKFHAATTAAATLNRDGLGARAIKQYDSAGAKVAAIIKANQRADVEYDGTDFVILDALPPQAATAASATADGAAGTAIYAKDSDTVSRNKAATPAGVAAQVALKAPLDSPALTGKPTAPTAATGTNTDQVATTAFVQQFFSTGRVQVFVSSGTWTSPPVETVVYVSGCGGGGGGGGSGTYSSGDTKTYFAGGGGGAGASAVKRPFTIPANSNVQITIGGGGSAGSIASGTSGGATKFGDYLTLNGGGGGTRNSASGPDTGAGGAGGTSPIGGGVSGGSGSAGGSSSVSTSHPGVGANGLFGGINGGGYGSGGRGDSASGSGGNGTSGILVIEW